MRPEYRYDQSIFVRLKNRRKEVKLFYVSRNVALYRGELYTVVDGHLHTTSANKIMGGYDIDIEMLRVHSWRDETFEALTEPRSTNAQTDNAHLRTYIYDRINADARGDYGERNP